MILKSVNTTYEFTPDDIKDLIAKELGKDRDTITVDFVIQEVGGDFMDRFRGVDTVTKINVTVKNK